MDSTTAVLLLADGTYFKGLAAGKIGTTSGEICFNTGMTGYQEIFTDPSYYGQIMVPTNAHIGNYGVNNSEVESGGIKIAGLVMKNFTNAYSRISANNDLQSYLQQEQVVGISQIDTRALVQHIRKHGAQNAIISSEITDIEVLKETLRNTPPMEGLELSSLVSTNEVYEYGNPSSTYKVACIDYGIKKNILRCLSERDCYLKIFPAKTSIQELNSWEAHGYFLSNGPGDPAAMSYAIEMVKHLLTQNKALFGICLGNQLLGSAVGIPTYKMHHGHRGLNHPVKNIETGYCEITSQNHGFSLDKQACLKNEDVVLTHINLNDDTIEGIRIKNKKAFSVQYHPESSPGPHDSRYLFDKFVSSMQEN